MQDERYGWRDSAYSIWHRRGSIRRFVGIEAAQALSMIDIDATLYVEYDDLSREPLALIETARDVGQARKPATVTANLARLAGLPAYCVLYRPADRRNPGFDCGSASDIDAFRVKRIWPRPESGWRKVTPAEWAKALIEIRRQSAYLLDRAESQAEYRVLSVDDIPSAVGQLELLPA